MSLLRWYRRHARDLPWRQPGTSPWAVLVSEVMAQQTPVERVVPFWRHWTTEWPTPSALAAAPPATVIRAWGTLGYPRRSLRLRQSAQIIADTHRDRVPDSYAELVALPGIGDYTANAVLAFAFGQRAIMLDTNVRRVLARWFDGKERPSGSVTLAERQRIDAMWPRRDAAKWGQAVMELGALVCTATNPKCDACPLLESCAWVAAGKPLLDEPRKPAQRFHGTDRYVRGIVLKRVRESSVRVATLFDLWSDTGQVERAIDTLVVDGLIERRNGWLRLPD